MGLIDIQKLSKRYGTSRDYALRGLTLTVGAGEVYGFLGSNGAGKSTTIRLLLNFLQPTSGSAQIAGLDVVRDSVAIKRQVGYLAGDVALYSRMTGKQFLDYMSTLQPAKPAIRKQLVNTFDVPLNKRISELSKGNRQKLGIVQAFMHEPTILILDEPTSGLDPLMQEAFYELVSAQKARGAAVFVSSHNFTEVERMCDRAGIIRQGKLVDEKRIADMRALRNETFVATFAGPTPLRKIQDSKLARILHHDGPIVTLAVIGDLPAFLALLASCDVIKLESKQPDLEGEFLRYYGNGSTA
jgi:ABC-2 type transport system ATP-binding protein